MSDLLTIQTAARRLGLAPDAVRAAITDGRLATVWTEDGPRVEADLLDDLEELDWT
jgi:hypothetical protein